MGQKEKQKQAAWTEAKRRCRLSVKEIGDDAEKLNQKYSCAVTILEASSEGLDPVVVL